MFWVSFVLYIDVLNISIRFSVRFSIYECIQNYVFKHFPKIYFSEMMGMQSLFQFVKLFLRSWDLSHRVQRQKLMVTSWEEVSVRV